MPKSGWCMEGRHTGTKPRYSRPCASPKCSCECHTQKEPRFQRKKAPK